VKEELHKEKRSRGSFEWFSLFLLLTFIACCFLRKSRHTENLRGTHTSPRVRRRLVAVILIILLSAIFIVIYIRGYPLFAKPVTSSDPIYLIISPIRKIEPSTSQTAQVRLDPFRFIFNENKKTITIYSLFYSANKSETYYLDIYLPYEVADTSKGTDTVAKTDVHIERASGPEGTYSLVRFTMRQSGLIDIDISVPNLTVSEVFGEKTIALTFGPPQSKQYSFLAEKYRSPMSEDLTKLTNIWLTIGVSRDYEFTSDAFPNPALHSITPSGNFATWILDFSGPLSMFYVSVHCAARNFKAIIIQELSLYLFAIFISLLAQIVVDVWISPHLFERTSSSTCNGAGALEGNVWKSRR
jgi:hypothetical protein